MGGKPQKSNNALIYLPSKYAQNMNNILHATANRIHTHARKFTKRQIAAMTAVTMGLAAVTIATFSQEPAAPEGKAVPMKLPTPTAQPLWIESKDGRKIAARVMARDDKGITVLRHTATGYEEKPLLLSWEDLGPSARQMLDGEKTWEEIAKDRSAERKADAQAKLDRRTEERRKGSELQQMVNELSERRLELNKKFFHLSAKDQQQALIENGRDIQVYLASHRQQVMSGAKSTNVTHTFSWDFAKTLVIPDQAKDETVSLRPEFERLGVVATKQVGDSCSIYASFHLAQFLMRKHGIAAPSIQEWQRKAVTENLHGKNPASDKQMIFDHEVVDGIKSLVGNRNVHVTWTIMPLGNLKQEVTKELLRKGVPVLIEWVPPKADGYVTVGAPHSSLIVGFVTKDGVTQWEIIDSNHVDRNGGYKFIRAEKTQPQFGVDVK
jgi:hypothetical protein